MFYVIVTNGNCMGGLTMVEILSWIAGLALAGTVYPNAMASNGPSNGDTQRASLEVDEVHSAVELGRRVAARYRSQAYLALSGTVEETENNSVLAQVYLEAEMADGRYLLNAALAQGVLTVSVSDGCVREEFRPAPGAPVDTSIEYDATRPGGTSSIQLQERLGPREGCMIGGMLATWVGESARPPTLLSARISKGKLLPESERDGHSCYVVEYSGFDRKDTFFIQRDSLLLCEWRTTYTDGPLRVEHYWLDPRAEVPAEAFGGSAPDKKAGRREVLAR
jgi:hypothetical protein